MENVPSLEENEEKFFSLPAPKLKTSGITITHNKISIDDNHEPFHDSKRRLRRVNIRDEGKMNVMEISYESAG